VPGAGTIRLCAGAAVALLAGYYALRVAAQRCSGGACDAYIPFSLLLPVAILVMVAVTGVIAISAARPAGGAWLVILAAATALGVFGPLAALAVLKDRPDALVPAATLLFVLTPVAALAYTFRRGGPPEG
jgi:hypothetical protein